MKTIKLTKQEVSRAIFSYLEGKGKTPNRKRGVKLVSVTENDGYVNEFQYPVENLQFSVELR